jgi:hypothetical protein
MHILTISRMDAQFTYTHALNANTSLGYFGGETYLVLSSLVTCHAVQLKKPRRMTLTLVANEQ